MLGGWEGVSKTVKTLYSFVRRLYGFTQGDWNANG